LANKLPPRGAGPGKLLQGSVRRHLLGLGGPMLVGIISIALMNVIDTFFISRLGSTELAAMAFTLPVVMIIGSVTMGLGIGTTSAIARAIGSGHDEGVRRLTSHALLLAVSAVVLLSLIGAATIDPLFRAMGASDATLPLVREYMLVWYVGMVCLVVPMVGNSAIRATGDTRTPAAMMLGAAAVNIALDPVLIFGWGPIPEMGLRGAAIATVAARAMTLAVSLWVLVLRERMIQWRPTTPAVLLRDWAAVLRVGLPSAATNLVVPITVGLLTAIVAREGEDAVAAYGAGSRLEMLLMMAPMALGAGLAPFAGQNWGAGYRDRLARALQLSNRFVIGWGVAMAAIAIVFAGPIAALFAPQEEVARLLRHYLWLVPLGFGLQGMLMIASATFNAIDQPLKATALAALRAPLIVVPAAWIGSALFGVEGVFGALALSNLAAGSLAWWWTRPLRAAQRRAAPADA
jgi:putative MATE family efflux protein